MRANIRSNTATGWSVRNDRGRTRLLVRPPGQPMQTIGLPFDWSRAQVASITARVRNIYVLSQQGHDLQAAAQIADGKATPDKDRSWPEAKTRFRTQKLDHGAAIRPTTWDQKYEPVLLMAVELLAAAKPPASPADLLDACLRSWAPGSRSRQIRAQVLAQFLKYCVEREHFPESWRPPAELRSHIGVPSAAVAPGHQKGDPFSDLDVLSLLESLPVGAAGLRWANALQLMAELGLRPVELQHLTVRTDPSSGQPLWWCSYRKRSGGGMTAPRWIHPLPLTDWDGRRMNWQLLSRWRAGAIELPPLGSVESASDAINTYLKRQKGWQELRTRLAARGERAVPYSFRHGYSLRGHQLGIDPGSVALSMGHSLEVHLRSYPWASRSGAAAAFARALGNPLTPLAATPAASPSAPGSAP